VRSQLEEVEVAQRLGHGHRSFEPLLEPRRAQPRTGARVDREERRVWQPLGELDHPLQPLRDVDVAGAVDRHQDVLALGQAVVHKGCRALLGDREERQRDVSHHVAYQVHALGDVLAGQVRHGRRGRAEEQVARVVCQHAVELLGHGAVEGAHSGLDVRDRDAQLCGRERTGERGVGVAVDQDQLGRELLEQRRECREHAGGLLGVRAAMDVQLAVRGRDAELVEEDPAELVVVVLTCVDQNLVGQLAELARDRGGLHELRPISDNCRYRHCVTCPGSDLLSERCCGCLGRHGAA
jgi:hypothetical protein